ncbi:class A beta-lactamase-related serine hydrolase [Streptomyces venezuelae]|uniref:serine hydrolase domain-containing protein n=1 Tax=Streptomyces venezuelae TaxID=54571 RepID=UPI00123BCFF6|nr:serine hydrolase domain-containing protein [Streptomyces venezuelae]QES06493.1 class A beta-lactamase-related serine hydrolase [Streptomyces venezuelae]
MKLRSKIRLALVTGVAALTACAGTVAAAPAPHPPQAGPARQDPARLDPARLRDAMDDVHRAGVPGVFGEVRDQGRTWRGASGVADLATGRPVSPGMRQRVGSITKTFTAAAVMRQAERGRIRLDAPVGDYLPDLVPGERGRKITVRMLLNNTSGIPDYIPYAFPSLQRNSPTSLDDNRFREFGPDELIALGLAAPPTGEPGGPVGVYSNTNWLLLGRLLERVTGTTAERVITRDVIERAGLRHTGFPDGPTIDGPHARMYESLWGLLDPPRDYSVYNMSWTGTGAALVSTMDDLNRFYARLLDGGIVSRSSLAQMQRTVPVRALDGTMIEYGLGLHKVVVPGCGTFWGHDGTVWGAGTLSLTRADGRRQMSIAVNLQRWSPREAGGTLPPHPIDTALKTLSDRSLCGS